MQTHHQGTNEGNAKLGQRGRKGVTWPTGTFKILRPPQYLGNGGARKVKFGTQIHHQGY